MLQPVGKQKKKRYEEEAQQGMMKGRGSWGCRNADSDGKDYISLWKHSKVMRDKSSHELYWINPKIWKVFEGFLWQETPSVCAASQPSDESETFLKSTLIYW